MNNQNIFLDSLNHLDKLTEPFAKEHYGFYIMCRKKNNSLSRKYFSQKHKNEYLKTKILEGDYRLKSQLNKKSKSILIEDEKDQNTRDMILTIQQLFSSRIISDTKTDSLIRGLKLFYNKCLDYNILYPLKDGIFSLKTIYQSFAYLNLLKRGDRRLIGEFLTEVSNLNKNFQKYRQSTNKEIISSYAIPSVVIYQLNKFAIEEMDSNIKKYKFFCESLNKVDEVITQKKILKTIINEFKEKNKVLDNYYIRMMLKNLDEEHLLMLEPYLINKVKLRSKSKDFIESHQNKIKKIEIYLDKVIPIEKNEEAFIIWESHITEGFFHNKISNIYNDILPKNKNLFINYISKIMGVRKKVSRIRLPGVQEIYPLYLLCLIETGHNHETLQSWKIRKVDNGYDIGTDKIMVISIDGNKKRGGEKEAPSFISKNHKLYKFIKFYLEWAKPIYDETGDKSFFQYYVFDNNSGSPYKKISDRMFFGNLSSTENNFFNKYYIFNSEDERVKWIDHSNIRKSSNYQRRLQGKTEYERRIALNHDSSQTAKLHYERNLEWNEDKNIKLGDILESIFDTIFSGRIEREEQDDCSTGLLGDCSSNNTNPNFIGVKEKDEDKGCLNWKKCLTKCDHCVVIPEIHGPAIVAWSEYLEELKENFISNEYWEKEGYPLDLKAANEVIKRFTDKERSLCKKNSYKFYNLVRVDFKTTYKKEKLS